tara:strand:- start:17300 stop:17842 length:543 start_codon:yes stop_codon:yes gene_type:complete
MSKNHYVNNKEFFAAICAFRESVIIAKAEEKPRPRVTEYIGHCIKEISVNLSRKPNFMNYRFREEMIGDGIENSLMYIDNFNPEKSQNPFAYFTQIIYYAFLRRIQKEKTQLYTKYKLMEDMDWSTYEKGLSDLPIEIKHEHTDWSQEYINKFIVDFETNKRKEIAKRNEKKNDNSTSDT